jgi:hypothetical protein
MATNSIRDAQQRARGKLAERRQREDQLIDAAAGAVAAREEALTTLEAADAALAQSVADLAEMGISRDELAVLLDVSPDQLGGKARGRPRKAPAAAAGAAGESAAAGNGSAEHEGTTLTVVPEAGAARPAARGRKKSEPTAPADEA